MIRAEAASNQPKARAWPIPSSSLECSRHVGLVSHHTRQFTHSSWLVGAATNLASWVSVSGIPVMMLQSHSLGQLQPYFPFFGEPWIEQLHSFRASCGFALTCLVAFAGGRELYRLSVADSCKCDFICSTCGWAQFFYPRSCVARAQGQTYVKHALLGLWRLARSLES